MDSLAIELRATKDFTKLKAGLAILGYIASVSHPISTKAFSQLLSFLGHRYPKVLVTSILNTFYLHLKNIWLLKTFCFHMIQIRKAAAEQVYLALLQNGVLVTEEKMEKVIEIISESCWEADMETTKTQRLELCELAGLDHEVVFKTRNRLATRDIAGNETTASDENASYSSLVDSSGF